AHDLTDRVQPVLEPGHDAEVATAAAERPEEIRMRLGIDAQKLAVRGDDFSRQERVDRQAVLAYKVPDPTAQRDSANPDRGGIAEPGREAMRSHCHGVFTRGQTRLSPRRAPFDIDLQGPHVREIDHESPVGHAVTGAAVA